MSLLQVQIEDSLSTALKKAAKTYGVTKSALVKITLSNAFLSKDSWKHGNIFNADRDNNGQGISLDLLLDKL